MTHLKAYISDRTARHSDDSRADTWNLAHAAHELGAILAETEPCYLSCQIMNPTPADRRRPYLSVSRWGLPAPQVRQALAEALDHAITSGLLDDPTARG